jgi:hypothetical protein
MSSDRIETPTGVRGLGHAADDLAVVPAAISDRLCSHDDAGTEPRLDRIALQRKTWKLDLLEILEVRPFDRENELLQLIPARGSPGSTSCNSSSSEHLFYLLTSLRRPVTS